MAVQRINYFAVDGDTRSYIGASSDLKSPEAPVGSDYFEYDSGLEYIKTPIGWRLKGGQTIVISDLKQLPNAKISPTNTVVILTGATPVAYFIVDGEWVEVE